MPARPAVLLLTGANYPQLAVDDRFLAAAFRADGWQVVIHRWQDPMPEADVALIRSCWDYTDDPQAFLASLEAVAAQMALWNPIETVRWNLDKRYLLQLAEAGAPVPPTRLIARGDVPPLASLLNDLGTDELVLKPVIGAGGADTWRVGRGDEALWSAVAGRHAALAQPFLSEVITGGEVSLTFLHGAYSHAVVKHAAEGEFRVQEDHGGRVTSWDAPADVVATADAILRAIPHPWRYARVDGILSAGRFMLMEIELVEPELFFRVRPDSVADFVAEFRS